MDLFFKKLEFLHKVLSVYILRDHHSEYFISLNGQDCFPFHCFYSQLTFLLCYHTIATLFLECSFFKKNSVVAFTSSAGQWSS